MPLIATIVIVAVLAAGGGITVASKDAMPGDKLYRLKTSVAEPIEANFKFGSKEHFSTNIRLAEERLEEALTLLSQNKLDATTRMMLEKKFAFYSSEAFKNIKELQGRSETQMATELSNEFIVLLRAYEKVFVEMETENSLERDAFLLKTYEIRQQFDQVSTEIRSQIFEESKIKDALENSKTDSKA